MSPLDGQPSAPGRSCPLHYRYRPEVFVAPARADLCGLDVLYVAGGLYGNELALRRVLELFSAEVGRKRLVFNGDFHWFDAEPERFERIQRSVLTHVATRGNVETELAADTDAGDAGCGCGCAYPDWVGDGVVERSNRILRRLREATTPAQRAELAALPPWLRADVGEMHISIVHGDAESLAGWGFAQEHLRNAADRERVGDWFDEARVDAFACTHTCLPVFQRLPGSGASRWIFNNGAAGMPNFTGDPAGLLTRIALTPAAPGTSRFGVRHGTAFIDAIAIEIDPADSKRLFLDVWPAGSDAHMSYYERIVAGPAYRIGEALRVG